MAVPAMADDVVAKPISDTKQYFIHWLGMDGELLGNRAQREGREKI